MWKIRLFLALSLVPMIAWSYESDESHRSLSPDKKLEYRVTDEGGAIVKSDSGEVVFKLEDADTGSLALETGRVLWAPDSRRFAFNYRSGGRYYACAVYELAGGEWKARPEFATTASEVTRTLERAEQRDRKRISVGKNASRRRINDEWRVKRWIDQDTLEVLAISQGSVVVNKKTEDVEYIGGAVLFTVKCNNRGGWKIIRLRELSDADLEKMNKEDQAAPEKD